MSSFASVSPKVNYISTCTFPSTQVNAGGLLVNHLLTSFNQPTLRASIFGVFSQVGSKLLTSCEIDWANSTFSSGTSPQLRIDQNNLDATEIDRIFTALPTVTGKTINVTNNPGYATCNKAIAEAKGWTVS